MAIPTGLEEEASCYSLTVRGIVDNALMPRSPCREFEVEEDSGSLVRRGIGQGVVPVHISQVCH